MKFSICIPTYEMKDRGCEFLTQNFKKIKDQSFKDFEVIISDHSEDNRIKNLCEEWSNFIDIKYFKNINKIGSSSANINYAISKANGEWIKILFQDDFLHDSESLSKINSFIEDNKNCNWLVTACDHSNDGITTYRKFYPTWHDKIYTGNNTLSSPSVVSIKNKKDNHNLFDEDLIWMMDVDFYQKLYMKYGEPYILNEITVVNRTWDQRLSDIIPLEKKNQELEKVINRYNKKIQIENIFSNICNLNFNQDILYGRGIVDINEHLPVLRKYASQCEHVTEMGTRFAISTYALLIAKPKKLVSIDLNYHFFKPYHKEILNFANLCEVNFEFIEGDVLKLEMEKTDLLLIDTLHTYNQLSKELRKHEKNVNRWIILHDTITFGEKDEDFYNNGEISQEIKYDNIQKQGLYNALLDFLEENKNWKIKEHFINNNGLTIIERI
jgi:hypothetical protein